MAELLTRWERRGMQQGLEQGRQEGLERGQVEGMGANVLRQLAHKQIPIDVAAEARIRSLDRDMLLALADALFDLQTRADLDGWLARATT